MIEIWAHFNFILNSADLNVANSTRRIATHREAYCIYQNLRLYDTYFFSKVGAWFDSTLDARKNK
jgi:hypothetical protein